MLFQFCGQIENQIDTDQDDCWQKDELVATTFSSSLEMKGRSDLGLKLFRTDESRPGFFKMGVTAANFNDSGTDLEETEQFIKWAIGDAITARQFLRIEEDAWSNWEVDELAWVIETLTEDRLVRVKLDRTCSMKMLHK